jgi:hypothetical protein
MVLQISLWSGIVTLYLGIAGAVGVFSRQAVTHGNRSWDRLLAATYTFALFLPSSAFVLAMAEWPAWARVLLFTIGLFAAWAAYARPNWAPPVFWRRAFAHRYLAGVMALAALWGINQALAGSAAAPMLIAVSAIAAGAASSGTSLTKPKAIASGPQ